MPATTRLAPRPWPIADLCDYLAGAWRIARMIADRRLGWRGRLKGEGNFTPSDECLVYEEQGELAYGEWRGLAWQAYDYVFDAPTTAAVRFRDGRLFHVLDLSTGEASVSHVCADDRYQGRFLVRDVNTWEMRWTIAGPRKDQTIVTRFRRRSPRRAAPPPSR